jgi:ABC-type transport system involved in multi-copper enzyme maturation permease subunit
VIRAVARLSFKRLLRSRTLLATVILAVIPIPVAVLALLNINDPRERWHVVAEFTLRSLVLLAPVLHLAPAINEENEGKTYTYLWSRPIRREELLFGKLLAVTPAAAALAVSALAVGFGILSIGGGTDPIWLVRALVAAVAGVFAASCFALGIGALFPRHPLIVAMGYVIFAEQILPQMRALQNVSTLYHAKTIAGLRILSDQAAGTMVEGLIGFAILSAVWLSLAVWRIRRMEMGSADG